MDFVFDPFFGAKKLLNRSPPGQCDPNANADKKGPCCSSDGHCGNTDKHCKCPGCTDFRKRSLSLCTNAVENDTAYKGHDVNKGREELQPNVESCRSFCKTKYKAPYFEYIQPDSPDKYKKSCWCKRSKDGRVEKAGSVSGNTYCLTDGVPRSVCAIENGIAYKGHDVNKGREESQPNMESCRSFCRTKYKATYFEYIQPDSPDQFKKSCWCKTSNSGREEMAGSVSGYAYCPADCCESVAVIRGVEPITDDEKSIFTIYHIEENLLNGKVHYTSEDGKKAIAYSSGKWRIQPVEDKGTDLGTWAFAEFKMACPEQTEHKWKYYDQGHGRPELNKEKGGLHIECGDPKHHPEPTKKPKNSPKLTKKHKRPTGYCRGRVFC